ncbi:MAG TPA: PAS domain-containing protein, partial [Actinomycetota bacterium]
MSHDGPIPLDLDLEVRRLFQASPEALFVVRAGRIEGVNARLVDLLGSDPTGAAVRDLIPEWRDDPSAAVPYEAALMCPDGDPFPVEIRVGPANDGAMVVSVRDAR